MVADGAGRQRSVVEAGELDERGVTVGEAGRHRRRSARPPSRRSAARIPVGGATGSEPPLGRPKGDQPAGQLDDPRYGQEVHRSSLR